MKIKKLTGSKASSRMSQIGDDKSLSPSMAAQTEQFTWEKRGESIRQLEKLRPS